MKEQKLKRVTQSDRRKIVLAVSQNKRSRRWQEAKLDAQFGPHTCGHCRAEPCGSMWPHGACCHRCTHLPMPDWELSHVLWFRKKPYYVMEVVARRPGVEDGRKPKAESLPAELEDEQRYGVQTSPVAAAAVSDAVYYRWDGVVQWVRRARAHYFLGVRVSPAEFLRSRPNEEELAAFAPRERAPHPFEQGVTASSDDELGEPFLDQTEPEPAPEAPEGRYYKKGLQFVEVDDTEGDPEQEAERDDDEAEG